MDHYSPLCGIIDALTKLRYEIPYFGSGKMAMVCVCVCVFIEIKSIVMEQELDFNILMLLWALVLVSSIQYLLCDEMG
jgi:bacteriorhodopsin